MAIELSCVGRHWLVIHLLSLPPANVAGNAFGRVRLCICGSDRGLEGGAALKLRFWGQ